MGLFWENIGTILQAKYISEATLAHPKAAGPCGFMVIMWNKCILSVEVLEILRKSGCQVLLCCYQSKYFMQFCFLPNTKSAKENKSFYTSCIDSCKSIPLHLTFLPSCLKTPQIWASTSLWSTYCLSEESQAVSWCPHYHHCDPVAQYIWHCHC